jgi:hypothetical protein
MTVSFSFDLDDGETNGTVDLGRGKPDTLRDAQRIKHKRNEVLDIRIKRIFLPDRFCDGVFRYFCRSRWEGASYAISFNGPRAREISQNCFKYG